MSIPKKLIAEALKTKASIGREYDSTGKHVCYWYRRESDGYKITRHSVSGMLALLRTKGGYQL